MRISVAGAVGGAGALTGKRSTAVDGAEPVSGRGAGGAEANRAQPTATAIDAVRTAPPTMAAFRFQRVGGPFASSHK